MAHVRPAFVTYPLPFLPLRGSELRGRIYLQVDSAMSHVAETAPFLAPPLDLDKNEHAIRRISTPPVTMGLLSRLHAAPFEVLM